MESDLILMDIQDAQNQQIPTARNAYINSDKKANIPIVAMTANAFEEDTKSIQSRDECTYCKTD